MTDRNTASKTDQRAVSSDSIDFILDALSPFSPDKNAASDRANTRPHLLRAGRRPNRVLRAGRRLVKVGASGRLGRTTWILLGERDFVGSVREDTNFVVA